MKSNLPSLTVRSFVARSAIALATLAPIGSLQAVVTASSASGTGIFAGAQLLGVINVPVSPTGTNSASGGTPYTDNETGISANVNLGVPFTITAVATQGVLSSSLQSTVNGSPGSRSVSSITTLTGPAGNPFTATVADLPLLAPLITISATTVQTTASLSGDYGAVTAAGTTTLANLGLQVNGGGTLSLADLVAGLGLIDGTDINLATGVILRPNVTVLGATLGLADVNLVLNQQVQTTDPLTGLQSLQVTALALELNGVTIGAFTGLETDLSLAQSQVSLTAVPEPAAALLGGVALLGLAGRRRRLPC